MDDLYDSSERSVVYLSDLRGKNGGKDFPVRMVIRYVN